MCVSLDKSFTCIIHVYIKFVFVFIINVTDCTSQYGMRLPYIFVGIEREGERERGKGSWFGWCLVGYIDSTCIYVVYYK